MINPIQPTDQTIISEPLKAVQSKVDIDLYRSTLTFQHKRVSKTSYIRILFWPILWPLELIASLIIPTANEIDALEDLFITGMNHIAIAMRKPKEGKKLLRETLHQSNKLYKAFSWKLIAWAYGVRFMRSQILQMNMRMYAALGEPDAVEAEKARMRGIGFEPKEELELQLVMIRRMRRGVFRPLNWLSYGFLKALSHTSKKSGS